MTLLRAVKIYQIHGYIFWAQKQIYTPLIHGIFGYIWAVKLVYWFLKCSDYRPGLFSLTCFDSKHAIISKQVSAWCFSQKFFLQKKHVMLLYSFLNMKQFSLVRLSLCLSLGTVLSKNAKNGDSEKKKKGGSP